MNYSFKRSTACEDKFYTYNCIWEAGWCPNATALQKLNIQKRDSGMTDEWNDC